MVYEARDRSAPMDVDSSHPLGRLAEYAVNDEPPKKRPHSDLSSGPMSNPFAEPSSYRFGPNTPFLFHAPISMPPAPKFEPYDPNKWARADFGFGRAATVAEADDVEMSNGFDSPARPKAARSGSSSGGAGVEGVATSAAAVAEAPGTPAGEARKIATGAVTRVRRKREKAWRRRRGQETDSEGEEDGQKGPLRSMRGVTGRSEHTYNLHMAAPAVQHSEIPAILLGYVQFVFNASLVVGFLYIAVQFVLAVRNDVKDRIEEYSVEILQEIAGCTQAYLTNRCEPSLRVPAMEAACYAWETCMNRDPTVVGRARVGAETFAGVINSFVDPISWKTMGFTLVTLTFLIILTNSALFNLRAKHQAPAPIQSQAAHPPMPMGLQGMYPPQYVGQYAGQAALGAPMQGQPGATPGAETGGSSKALGWLKKW